MKGIRFFINGFGIRNVRPAAFAWTFNFGFALVVFYVIGKLLSYAIGESIMAEALASGGLFTLVSELIHHSAAGVWVTASLGFFFIGLFLIVSIFLSGAVYSALIFDEKATFRNLISAAIGNFFKLAVVFLINAAVWLAAGAFSLLAMFGLIRLHSSAFARLPLESFLWAGAALAAAALLYASAIHDFSKIFRLSGERSGLASFVKAIRFVFSSKFVVAVVSVSYLVSVGAILLVYGLMLGSAERIAAVPLSILSVACEALIFFRYYLKTVLIRSWIHIASPGVMP